MNSTMWDLDSIENGSRKYARDMGTWDSFAVRMDFAHCKLRQIAAVVEVAEEHNQSKISVVEQIQAILNDTVKGS